MVHVYVFFKTSHSRHNSLNVDSNSSSFRSLQARMTVCLIFYAGMVCSKQRSHFGFVLRVIGRFISKNIYLVNIILLTPVYSCNNRTESIETEE
jgi:hypothetical protein